MRESVLDRSRLSYHLEFVFDFKLLNFYLICQNVQDSYSDGGKDDGSPLSPPILIPPSSLAGGRSTNGLVWVEHVANDIGATLKDYAVRSAHRYSEKRSYYISLAICCMYRPVAVAE